jgi:hypothetical protein
METRIALKPIGIAKPKRSGFRSGVHQQQTLAIGQSNNT